MVQSQTTSQPLNHNRSNKTGQDLYLHKMGYKANTNLQVQIEQNTFKNRCKSQGLKLQPLTLPKLSERKKIQCSEKIHLDRFNSSNQGFHEVRRKVPSKIPVLQKPVTKIQNNDSYHFDSTLSAADKRQKFHQSRQYITPTIKSYIHVQEQQNKIAPCSDFIPRCKTINLTNVNLYSHSVCSKLILPPIKSVNTALQDERCSTQVKKKCLMGEFTHFPKLCNIATKPVRNFFAGSVPHLPPIFLPPAPPPTVSTSLERNSSCKGLV